MNWQHPQHPDRRVRLAYCLNLHAAETLDETIAGIRAVTIPLRDRLARGAAFGVGMYLPARVAVPLASSRGARDLERLSGFLADQGLDPFTYNAFPYGGFHRAGLKRDVFRPTWMDDERVEFTLAVARVAAALAGARDERAHLSISTHSGRFGRLSEDEVDACARNLASAALAMSRIESGGGARIVLALEPEPRASSGDTRQLASFLPRAWDAGARALAGEGRLSLATARDAMVRHVGTCLDTCHAAVEFEGPECFAFTAERGALGKLQFSSALAVKDPARNRRGVEQLLSMDEPRYLHQVTGRAGEELARADDIADLSSALARGDTPWQRCDEWRCHFHVPVDLERVGSREGEYAGGLSTTRARADEILAGVLALDAWPMSELHLEIETYTWDILPGAARGSGPLVDGLEREYAHVMGELERAGWRRA